MCFWPISSDLFKQNYGKYVVLLEYLLVHDVESLSGDILKSNAKYGCMVLAVLI